MNRRIRGIPILLFLAGFCAACGGSSGTPPIPPAEKTWGAPVLLQQDNTTGSSHDPDIPLRLGPVVRFDAPGNAMVAWPQQGAAWDIVAVRYDGAWGTGSALDNASENAFRPMFAWDGTGAGHLVWYEWDGFRYNMMARRILPTGEWEASITLIAADCGDTPEQWLAADGDGNAFVIWNQNQTVKHVVVARYDWSTGAWSGSPVVLDDNDNASDSKIAVNDAGVAFAAWIRYEALPGGAFRRTVHVGRYVPSLGGWQPPQRVSGDNVIANEVEIAVDGSGNAIAAWAEQDAQGAVSHILARRYASGSGWEAAVPVETDNTARSGSFRLRMNAAGTAFAAWRHSDEVANHLWANRFDPAQGWGTAGPIEPDTAENVTATPAVAVDPGGNAVALWRRGDGPGNSLFANRYVAGHGWGDPVPVESEAGDVAPELGLDVDPEGNAIAVWLQDDGSDPNGKRYTVRANVLR